MIFCFFLKILFSKLVFSSFIELEILTKNIIQDEKSSILRKQKKTWALFENFVTYDLILFYEFL